MDQEENDTPLSSLSSNETAPSSLGEMDIINFDENGNYIECIVQRENETLISSSLNNESISMEVMDTNGFPPTPCPSPSPSYMEDSDEILNFPPPCSLNVSNPPPPPIFTERRESMENEIITIGREIPLVVLMAQTIMISRVMKVVNIILDSLSILYFYSQCNDKSNYEDGDDDDDDEGYVFL